MRSPSKMSPRISSRIAALLVISAMALTSACSYHQKEESNSGDLKVQVPVYAQGKYTMSVEELGSILDLTHLKGAAANILIEPHQVKNSLRGRAPEIHYFRNSHGVIVATDSDSLQMLALYTQFEKLRVLDQTMGVESANKWPVKVAVNAVTKLADGNNEENNAFYTGQFDAYLFAPYSQSQLPLAVNSGVIGHEHFHSLFQHLVIDPLKEKYPDPTQPTAHDDKARLKAFGLGGIAGDDTGATDASDDSSDGLKYNALLLRGLNEGLADVWGWIYSGDQDFVQRSLSGVGLSRSLRMTATGLPSQAQFMDQMRQAYSLDSISQKNAMLGGIPYQFGHQVALTVKAVVMNHNPDMSTDDIRKETAKLVVAALPAIRDEIAALASTETTIVPGDLLMTIASKITGLTNDDCQVVQNLIPLADRKKNACGASSDSDSDDDSSPSTAPTETAANSFRFDRSANGAVK